jgi:hypothetical protein
MSSEGALAVLDPADGVEDGPWQRNDSPDGDTAQVTLPYWVSSGLMTRTQEVWARQLGRPISPAEAIEMLVNVKRLAEIFIDQAQQQKKEASP